MILLIEPYAHYEVLDAMLRLLSTFDSKITCISSIFCYQHSNYQKTSTIKWCIAQNSEEAMVNHEQTIKKARFVLCTTIDPRSKLWTMLHPSQTVWAFVHNGHSFFHVKQYLNKSWFQMARYLYSYWKGDFEKNRAIANRLDKIIVPSSSIKRHLDEVLNAEWSKKAFVLSFALPQSKCLNVNRKIKHIVIPGTLTNNRRDYDFVIEVLPLLDKKINQKVMLHILGKPESKDSFQQLRALPLSNIKLKLSNDYVSPEDFENQLQSCAFLWLPIRETIRYKGFHEIRGKSCVSGNINDMVKYALPALLPAFYPLDKNLEQMTERYEGRDDCIRKLKAWIEKESYLTIKQKASPILATHLKEVQNQWLQLYVK